MKMIFSFTLLAMLFFIPVESRAEKFPDITARDSGIREMLKTNEQWTDQEIVSTDIQLDGFKKFKRYFSKFSCGSGICQQYIFQQAQNESWHLIGVIPGRIEIKKENSHGLFNLLSASSVGRAKQEGFSEIYKFDGVRYKVAE